MHEFLPRDYVETAEGLYFAVVADDWDEQRLPGVLRYARTGDSLRKLTTEEAQQLLESSHPEYLYFSSQRDIQLHGVPRDRIHRHHSVRRSAIKILRGNSQHRIENKAKRIIELFIRSGVEAKRIGVSGSLAIGSHHSRSDIDLVMYDRREFFLARDAVRQATADGQLQPLDDRMWHETYQRRRCSLSLEEFVWHEQRKYNKLVIDGTKADVTLVVPNADPTDVAWKKITQLEIQARVTSDLHAFDYPARLGVDHPDVSEIASFTNTYFGQACNGELVTARGWKEQSTAGASRLLVGTSREAQNEFIKVVR